MNTLMDALNIPDKAKTKYRIPIKTMVDTLSIKRTDEKLLRDHIDALYIVGILNEDSTGVPSSQTEDFLYEEIQILSVQLKKNQAFKLLNEKLHAFFANPTVFLFEHKEKHALSTALKHANYYDKRLAVVDELYTTEFFSLDDKAHKPYISRLNIENHLKSSIQSMYLSFTNALYSERVIGLLGHYPGNLIKARDLKGVLKQIETYQNRLSRLQEDYKTAYVMADKMEIHMEIKAIKEKIDSLKQSLQEAL